jgi:hypothetical protein
MELLQHFAGVLREDAINLSQVGVREPPTRRTCVRLSLFGRLRAGNIRQGATENATVVGELLGDLVERGLDFITPRLYVLDGGKALTTAVKKYAGESAAIQRCQVHKRRNVLDYLADEQKPAVGEETERGLCSGRLRRRQASAEHAASRTDGSQSECGAEFE